MRVPHAREIKPPGGQGVSFGRDGVGVFVWVSMSGPRITCPLRKMEVCRNTYIHTTSELD